MRILIAAVLLALPATANASNWYRIAGNEKTVAYLDADSITTSGGKTSFWVWSVYSTDIGEGIHSARIHEEYECTASRFHTLEYVYFDENGKMLSSEPSASIDQMRYPAADSIDEAIMQFGCQRSGGEAVSNPLTDAVAQFQQ